MRVIFCFISSCNCVVEGAKIVRCKRVRAKRVREVGKKTSVFLLRATHLPLYKKVC
nr:hypothetical protein [Campylobacter troglodytis]